jgi:arginyl-tRNA synthetase
MSLPDRVRASLTSVLESMARAGDLGEDGARALDAATWVIERPNRPEHGDFATNVAMALAKRARKPPRSIADALVRGLTGSRVVASAEVAGPGFVNLRLHATAFHDEVAEILRAGRAWGRAPAATGERVDIEFVSANPTGPITVASGRNAILGDAVARLLEARGHRVTREYYVNDRGSQVLAFAASVRAKVEGREPPEDGYKGAYVAELASWLQKVDRELFAGPDEDLGRACVTWMLRGIPGSRTLPGIRQSLADLGVRFDVWFSEESLYRCGNSKRAGTSFAKTGRSSSKPRTALSRTRTASSRKAMERGPTLPRTSRTSPTRFHADTTGSSTSLAPTTTATSPASETRSRRWACPKSASKRCSTSSSS